MYVVCYVYLFVCVIIHFIICSCDFYMCLLFAFISCSTNLSIDTFIARMEDEEHEWTSSRVLKQKQ